jgi:tripartite-type tricarboxylate transporter receptor subunit TctC
MPSIIGHIRAGSVRALGVTSAQRSPALPDVPTVAETVPGYEASAWFGAAAPKGTPEEFWALHRMETEKWARIVQFSGAKAE